ncbi:MAG: M28 family peptidase [Bryobacteraceae bacterium]|jgi:Zn-dependent M28 family amino/carboxypeptidase
MLVAAVLLTAPLAASDFSGARALEQTRRAVSFGPRPPASAAIRNLRAYIETQLHALHCQVTEDAFIARTPDGPVEMKNIIARVPGSSRSALVVTGHYDTKKQPRFVGANDGGSSTGFLLELARVVAARRWTSDVYLVWFDGEEAFREWSDTDSLYGSRHLAERWARDGTLAQLKALINVDMIGDRNLDIARETNSSPELLRTVWKCAWDLGYGRYFTDAEGPIEDDHTPFLARGVNALDVIDFDYGPNNSWWHTPEDTLDKLSAHSFQVVGDVLVEALARLD